jgi:hypothetical protein
MKALWKLHPLIVPSMTTGGQRWTRLSRVNCIRRFHADAGSLILTGGINGRINCDQEGTTIMANGWIRSTPFPSSLSVVDTTHARICSATVVNEYRRRIYTNEVSAWLAQANDIFNRLKITRGFGNFGIFPVSRSSNCGDDFPSINMCY